MSAFTFDSNGKLVTSANSIEGYSGGFPFDSAGAMVISNGTSAPSTTSNGVPFDSNGAVAVDSSGSISYAQNGLPLTEAGRIVVDGTSSISEVSSGLPFASGKLVVDGGGLSSIQNIASAMRAGAFASGAQSNGTDTAHNSIKWVKNQSGQTLDHVYVVYPGWRVDTDANGSEVNNNGNLTVATSIEYPASTRIGGTFSGASTGTVVAGTDQASDRIDLAGASQIPDGAWFAIHTYIECSAGVKWPTQACANAFNGGKADNTENGAAGVLGNKTLAGAPAGTGVGYFPSAVLSDVGGVGVNLAAIGDSITAGSGDGNYDTANNTAWVGRAATGLCPIIQAAIAGTTASASAAAGKMNKRIAFMQLCGVTHCVVAYGTNDLYTLSTAAQCKADMETIIAQLNAAGIKAIPWTIIPRLTSASPRTPYQGVIAQTVLGGGFTAGTGSVRHTYNQYVRTGLTGAYDYLEAANALDVDASNNYSTGGGYMAAQKTVHQDVAYTGTISGTPTTTVFTCDVLKANSYFANFAGGFCKFLTGVNAGTVSAITSSTNAGVITLTSALGAAPSAGDTVSLTSDRCSATNDGTHPNLVDNTNSFGGHFDLRDVGSAKIATW